MSEEHEVVIDIKEPALAEKAAAAIFIVSFGADASGIRTKATLMWPFKRFTDDQVKKEASSFLAGVHIALLEALPLEGSEQILKDQVERLSFVL